VQWILKRKVERLAAHDDYDGGAHVKSPAATDSVSSAYTGNRWIGE
jgi:hypothetical protein